MFRNLLSVVGVMALVLGLAGIGNAGPVGGTIYWQFDENGTDAVDVLLARNLTRLAGSQTAAAVNPVPNPDTGTFLDGNPTDNPYAVSNPQLERTGFRPALQMLQTDPGNGEDWSWTLEGWFRRNGAPSSGSAVIAATNYFYDEGGVKTLHDGWTLRMTPTTAAQPGYIVFEARTDSTWLGYVSTQSYADNAWHHFAITWDGANGDDGWMQLYLDGVLQDEGAGGGDRDSNYFSVGMWNDRRDGQGPSDLWGGDLDEFRWTQQQVLVPNQFLNYVDPTSTDTPIAEPASLGLLGLALLGLRKRRN